MPRFDEVRPRFYTQRLVYRYDSFQDTKYYEASIRRTVVSGKT